MPRRTKRAAESEPAPEHTEAAVTPAQTDASDAPSAAEASSEPADAAVELNQVRAELAEAREQAERYHSNWQRSAADFQNWKRRADQEKDDARRLGESALTADLLRVLDDFERAFQALPAELRTLTWIEGIALIGQKLLTVLHARGLEPIEAEGQEFDPHLHEAVMREEDAEPGEQTAVVAELQRGYRFAGRVLRPSLVKVGKPRLVADSVDSAAGEPLGADASA